ncbi:SpoIIE family protein phosphatase [Actinocrinis sp.]|uniref:SpoIIE family protein phosphatase n=1 Tax=Actinocrinis sp. TaxID=1920516 RepID=UPI002BBEA675|nr:SpoIIE family protein phosphatase [Actinocrinis sp.]HXR73139.1 SpoIIE family protein phosphatase [Actinocrinis sp.]
MPAAFDRSKSASTDPEADAALRTVIGAEYGRSLTQLAAAALDPRHIEVERALFETLFDQVPVGIAIYDTERRYLLVNQAFADYNGIAAREHVGLRPEDVNPGLRHTVPLLQQRVLDTGEPVVDMLIKAATRATEPGGWQYWSISYARLQTEEGRVLGLTAVATDVTERQKASERERLAHERTALLNAANSRVGASLDIDRIAATLADVAVPDFCDAATVYLLHAGQKSGRASTGAKPVTAIAYSTLSLSDSAKEALRMHAVATRGRTDAPATSPGTRSQTRRSRLRGSSRSLPPIEPGTALYECIASGRSQFLALDESGDHASHAPEANRQGEDAQDDPDSERSIVAPLKARGSLLGAVRFARAKQRDAFTLVDLETAEELASHAAVAMDNARLYMRERDTALMLQRSLMPQQFDAVDGAQVAFRYRPGAAGAQVGGDWCDVIPLPCRRVAFVVGDVMGSGLSAAGIMTQFRTAARTLAQLDLSPALVLRELDELGRSMSESHLATCIYAVYDPVVGECVMASAGHPPPVLATSGGGAELIELSPGAPLGVGGQRFEERVLTIDPGCALALYTDGLVEGRDRDIESGIDELLGAISKSAPVGLGSTADASGGDAGSRSASAVADGRLEAACDAAFEALIGPHRSDDATLLIASLGRFPEDQVASWVLTSQPTVAARARELVRRCLHEWSAEDAAAKADDSGLSPLDADVADVVELLVSELVTNALRYGRGPIGLRLLRGAATVVCEVSDELEAAPRLRTVQHGEEGGRGLYLVDQLSLTWGTRTTAHGKIVWFEV